MEINALLQLAAEKNASDLHLIAGGYPWLRIDGRLIPVESDVITTDEMRQAFESLTVEEQKKTFYEQMELDFAYTTPDASRFRVNAAWQKGSISLVFRLVLGPLPSLEEMDLPMICKDLIMKPNGLVMLTGPTGSGKSTTLAAMIGYLNQTVSRRIITIEDPIEYAYPPGHGVITQREVGFDTLSFSAALKRALRQDPDVILVGEMRDMETASMVLMAAETGHLVLTTGHASSAPLSVERIIDLFPTHQQTLAQTRLAQVLQGVLCQSLMPRADGFGRAPAVEIMLANSAVRNLIREGKTHQLLNVMRTNQQSGMCIMDEALIRLYNARVIDRDAVFSRCVEREEVERMIGEGSDAQQSRQPVFAGM